MSGEVEHRNAEREAADRRYNDALTRLDRVLPRVSESPTISPEVSNNLDTRGIRDQQLAQPPDIVRQSGWRGRLARFVWNLVEPGFARQQELNEQIANNLERTAKALRRLAEGRIVERDGLQALVEFDSILIQYFQKITPFIDTKIRSVEAALDEIRMAAISARRAASAARHGVERHTPSGSVQETHGTETGLPRESLPSNLPSPGQCGALGAGYIGFEDLFRGSPEDIRARQADYADRLAGRSDVLDIGCGRGELLDLLRDRSVTATGIDVNAEMVDVCVARGLRAYHTDAFSYLVGKPDNSLDGVTALQVVEHLEPDHLVRLLETAFNKLRSGGIIIIETINASCWVAFFESYIRDITHVRALHPETLKFLVVAAGFEQVDVHFRSPIAETGRLELATSEGLTSELADVVRTINANVERLNERLFTYLDYAIIGIKGW